MKFVTVLAVLLVMIPGTYQTTTITITHDKKHIMTKGSGQHPPIFVNGKEVKYGESITVKGTATIAYQPYPGYTKKVHTINCSLQNRPLRYRVLSDFRGGKIYLNNENARCTIEYRK